MRFTGEGNGENAFDVSDIEDAAQPAPHVDSIDTILRLANEVISENAPAPGATRIERLARFVIENLSRRGAEVACGGVAKFVLADGSVYRVGGVVGVEMGGQKTHPLAEPLGLAAALIRATELACGD